MNLTIPRGLTVVLVLCSDWARCGRYVQTLVDYCTVTYWSDSACCGCGPTSSPGRTRRGTTIVAQAVVESTVCEVDPRSRPANPPRPRVPITTRSTSWENSARTSAGLPSMAWMSTSIWRPSSTSASCARTDSETSSKKPSWRLSAGIRLQLPY